MANMLERNKKVKAPQKTYQEHAEDALYREVWEDVNNEKTQQFLKKYGNYIIAGALVIMIIITSIQIGIRAHRAAKMATAENYETAIDNTDVNALDVIHLVRPPICLCSRPMFWTRTLQNLMNWQRVVKHKNSVIWHVCMS